MMGMSDQVGQEIDEFVTDTLRSNLLGLPLDLATINMTRARSEGVPSLNEVRRKIHAATNDGQLAPYTSWADFGNNLKHPESLVNFVAAYGTFPSVVGATTYDEKRTAAQEIVNPGFGLNPSQEAMDFINGSGDWATRRPASTTSTCGWVASPRRPTSTAACSAGPPTTCSRTP